MEHAISRAAYEGDIVSRLRNWRGLHLSHGGRLYEEAAGEIERLRLTDAEREALIVASIELQSLAMCETSHSDALRKLLARMS